MRASSRLGIGWMVVACALAAGGCASDGAQQRELLRELQEEQAERNAAAPRLAESDTASFASLLRDGDEFRDQGDLASALWSYLQAYRLDRTNLQAIVRIGGIHLSQDAAKAEEIFEALLKQEPESADALTGLAIARCGAGNPAAAIDLLRLAVKLEPRHAPALNTLGVLLDQRGEHAEARQLFEQAWNVQPRSHVPLNNLGLSFLATDELDRAVAEFSRAAQLGPRDATTQNNLGLALARVGRENEALAAFRRAGPEQAALNNMGFAAYKNRDFERALAWYEKALLERGPLAPEVRRNILAVQAARSLPSVP